MISARITALRVLRPKNPRIPAALQSGRPSVHSPIDRRKGRGAGLHPGPPFYWSESGAPMANAPADRALWRKDAQVSLYHLPSPGQTGMCSPSALWFPELTTAGGR
jgi:hypothetical protein